MIAAQDPFAEGSVEPFSADPRLRLAWDSSPALISVAVGPDLLVVYQNQASERLFGRHRAGTPLLAAFPELAAEHVAPLQHVLRTGDIIESPPRRVQVRDRTGQEVMLRYVLAPLGAPGSPPEGVVMTAVDVTAEMDAAEAARRARLLAEISERLAAARTPTAALQALTDALVQDRAEVAAVYVLTDPPRRRAPDAEPVPPQVLSVAESLRPLGRPPVAAPREQPAAWESSLRAGEVVILPLDSTTLPEVAPDPATAAWLTRAGAHTIAVLPLVAAGELAGVLLIMGAGDRPPYRDQDLSFFSDVAARAGPAIGRLWAEQLQHRVATDLQRALLPPAPRPIRGLEVAARYVAGAPGVEVGGDWWEVQDLGDRRAALGIGDISGRGVSAAAVMGQARAIMHAAGSAGLSPSAVLRLVDRQLHEVLGPGRLAEPAAPQFATACFGIIDLTTGNLCISNAGHLPPLVRRAGGDVTPLVLAPAAPVGLRVGTYTDRDVELRPGDILVLMTDGLVEVRGEDLDDGISALAAALARHGDLASLDELADALLATMSARPGYGGDDVALILARLTGD